MVARPRVLGMMATLTPLCSYSRICTSGLVASEKIGMLHRSHVVLGDGVGDVANEEVLDRVAIRQERGAGRQVFRS